MPKTMFDKIWDAHEVADGLIYIDLHLVHEVTSPQAFSGLRERGLTVRRPDRTLATVDHSIPTTPPSLPIVDKIATSPTDASDRPRTDVVMESVTIEEQ